jgi:hypothetical protein
LPRVLRAWGDWFGWLNLAALIGLIAALMQRKKTAAV